MRGRDGARQESIHCGGQESAVPEADDSYLKNKCTRVRMYCM